MFCQILLIVHIIVRKRKKFWERKEKGEKKRKIVVTSDGSLFCRLQKKETKGEGEEEEASKWVQLID